MQGVRGGRVPLKMNLADMLRRPHGYMLACVLGVSSLGVGCNCLIALGGRQNPLPKQTLTLFPLLASYELSEGWESSL